MTISADTRKTARLASPALFALTLFIISINLRPALAGMTQLQVEVQRANCAASGRELSRRVQFALIPSMPAR